MSRRTLPATRAAIAVLFAVSLLAGLGTLLSSCGSASTQSGLTPTTVVGSSPKAAPQFSGVTLDGKTVTLDGYRGKPLFLVYMTSG
jgi:hypothetical protein